MKTTVLFDLDGTLLPMDADAFVKVYFKGLSSALGAIEGKSADAVISSVWAATKRMIENDGSRTNSEVFWSEFPKVIGSNNGEYQKVSDAYYTSAFNDVKVSTSENPYARRVIDALRKKGIRVVLATNPIFPRAAVVTRLAWIGLSESDFDYITTYETESFCKPNPKYYESILKRLSITPDECVMVGNDEHEDMHAAMKAGIDTYCVTDCALKSESHPYSGKKGSMKEFCEAVERAVNETA